jgi:hypothetical protein
VGCFRGPRSYVTVQRRCSYGRVKQTDRYRRRSEKGEMESCVLAHEGGEEKGEMEDRWRMQYSLSNCGLNLLIACV